MASVDNTYWDPRTNEALMVSVGSADSIYWEPPVLSLDEKPDPVQMASDVKKDLSKRVVDLTTGDKARYKLDRCLNVEGPSKVYAQKMINEWSSKEQNYRNARIVGVLAAAVTFAAARTVPGGGRNVAAFLGLIWWMFSSGRINEAAKQAGLWSNPTYERAAELRAGAYLKPFTGLYANRQDLTPEFKTGFLHRNEVEYLYKKYLADFCRLLEKAPSTPQEKKEWMDQFLTFNPLSPAMMLYGLGKVPPAFEELGQEYSRLFGRPPVTLQTLRSKFAAGSLTIIVPTGAIGFTGVFHDPKSYNYKLEKLVVEYEHLFEKLKNDYLHQKERLKASYRSSSEFPIPWVNPQIVDDNFEYDLKCLKDLCISQMKTLKANYLDRLQKLKDQFSEPPTDKISLEERIEKRLSELQDVFFGTSNPREEDYENARNLLQRAQQTLEAVLKP
jgi:hypothetical protein